MIGLKFSTYRQQSYRRDQRPFGTMAPRRIPRIGSVRWMLDLQSPTQPECQLSCAAVGVEWKKHFTSIKVHLKLCRYANNRLHQHWLRSDQTLVPADDLEERSGRIRSRLCTIWPNTALPRSYRSGTRGEPCCSESHGLVFELQSVWAIR